MKHIDYKDFVCDTCFNQLTECTCKCGTYNLIQVDNGIQYAIRKLNEKGYITACSCEGHYEDALKGGMPYITFKRCYTFNTAPTGWTICHDKDRFSTGDSLACRIKCTSKFKEKRIEQFEEKRKQMLDNLNTWVDDLENNF